MSQSISIFSLNRFSFNIYKEKHLKVFGSPSEELDHAPVAEWNGRSGHADDGLLAGGRPTVVDADALSVVLLQLTVVAQEGGHQH